MIPKSGWNDPRLHAAAALAVVAAIWLALSRSWLFQGEGVPWDAKNHFYPMVRWLALRIHAGEWPFWMAETFAGRPSLSDPQSTVLSPSFLLLAALNPAPSIRAFDGTVLACLLAGGVAVTVFGLRRGWHPAAAVLAALVLMFGGSAMGRLQHTLQVQSYAFLAVAVLALDAAIDRPTWQRAALAGLAAGLLAVGRDQVAFLGLFLLVAYGLARVATAEAPGAFLRARLGAAGIAALVAILVAAVPVGLSLEFVRQSTRPAFDFVTASFASEPPVSVLTMLVPDLFGTSTDMAAYWGPGADTWGPHPGADRTTIHLYMGAVPFVLLAWVGVLRGRLFERGGRLFAALAVCFLIYGIGRYTPLFRLIYDAVPGVDMFRRPADATFLFGFATAFATGWLADRVIRDGLPPVPRWRLMLEIGLAVAAMAAMAGFLAWNGRLEERLWSWLVAAGLLVVAIRGGVELGRGPAWRRGAIASVLVLLTAVDLDAFSAGTPINARPSGRYAALERTAPDPVAVYLVSRVAEIEAVEGPIRVEVLGLDGPWQNQTMTLGVEDTLGYNPLLLADYGKATGAEQYSFFMGRPFGTLFTGYRSDFADILGVRLIVLGGPMEKIDPRSAPFFGPPLRVGRAYVYENPRAVPRALFVAADQARPHDPDELLAKGHMPGLDWRRQALIDPLPPAPPAPPPAIDRDGPDVAKITSYAAGDISIWVSATRPGFLVLHENAYPGWTATVDGEEQPILKANVLFQAIAIEPGDHEVRFVFNPLQPERLVEAFAGLIRHSPQ